MASAPELRPYWEWTQNASILAALGPFDHTKPSSISENDLNALLSAGIISPIQKDEILGMGAVFSVAEVTKKRRRSIFWPRQLNERAPKMPCTMPDTIEQAQDAWAGTYSAAADLDGAFYQIPLHANVARYFSFATPDGRYFCMNRAPMGFTWSCATMQATTEWLAKSDTRHTVFVDNVRYAGDEPTVTQAMDSFEARCRQHNVSYTLDTPGHLSDFLGQLTNFVDKTVALGEKTVNKLKEWLPLPATFTRSEAETLLGLLTWASRVARYEIPRAYGAIKFLRRTASRTTDDAVPTWASVRPYLARWIKTLIHTSFVPIKIADELNKRHSTLFSDSSLAGLGGVLVTPDGAIATNTGRWTNDPQPAHINELEAKAVAINLEHFASVIPQDAPLLILIDNTTTMYAMKRGSSQAALLTKEILRIQAACRSLNIPIYVDYIATSLNVADGLSRGREFFASNAQAAQLGTGRRKTETLRVAVPLPCKLNITAG